MLLSLRTLWTMLQSSTLLGRLSHSFHTWDTGTLPFYFVHLHFDMVKETLPIIYTHIWNTFLVLYIYISKLLSFIEDNFTFSNDFWTYIEPTWLIELFWQLSSTDFFVLPWYAEIITVYVFSRNTVKNFPLPTCT